MYKASKYIDIIVGRVGSAVSWLHIVLICIIGLDVLLRYGFDNTKNWVLELEWHLFALIFLIGSSYALQHDEHVRVDVIYQNKSQRYKSWVNILGHLLLLLPWCTMVVYTGYNYAANSFSFQEGSPNPGGLPLRYLIKSAIAFGFFLLFLQGISEIIRHWQKIKEEA